MSEQLNDLLDEMRGDAGLDEATAASHPGVSDKVAMAKKMADKLGTLAGMMEPGGKIKGEVIDQPYLRAVLSAAINLMNEARFIAMIEAMGNVPKADARFKKLDRAIDSVEKNVRTVF